MSQLLDGWSQVSLSEVAKFHRGVSYKKNESSDHKQDGFIPILRANNIQNGKLILDDLVYVPEAKVKETQLIFAGDIVVAMSSGSKRLVGKSGTSQKKLNASFGTFCGLLRPIDSVDSRYVGYFTRTKYYQDTISELSKGVNINNLKPKHFDEVLIPLAPKSEQKHVADKLDSIFEKMEMAQSRLEKVPSLLKRFRMSVLSAAVSGELTEEWREQHQPGSWKDKSIGALTSDIRYGTSKKCDYDSSLIPVLRIPNIANGSIDASDLKFSAFDGKEITKLSLLKGDILVIRSNGSVELVGKSAIITEGHEGYLFAGYLIRIRLLNNDVVIPEYLNLALQSPQIRRVIEINARSTSGINNINSKELAALTVPVPSPSEQKEIVRVVSELLSKSDLVKKQYEAAKLRVDKLTQSILARAFRGELFEPFSDKAERVAPLQSEDVIDEQPTDREETTLERADISSIQSQPTPKTVDDKSELLSQLKSAKKAMTAQQLFDSASVETFKAIDELFVELKRLLELELIEKVGEGESCQFKAAKP